MTKPTSPLYGIWTVRTDNDEEGRTTKTLGTFEGWLDEIVLSLADKVYYNLYVSRVEPSTKVSPPTGSRVRVCLPADLSSSTDSAERINQMLVEAGRGDKCMVEGHMTSVTFICKSMTADEIAKSRARTSGLAKLTDEEKKALGL